jgi:hypothetical protein
LLLATFTLASITLGLNKKSIEHGFTGLKYTQIGKIERRGPTGPPMPGKTLVLLTTSIWQKGYE